MTNQPLAVRSTCVLAVALGACTGPTDQERDAAAQFGQVAMLVSEFAIRDQRLPRNFDELFAVSGANRSLLISSLATDQSKPSYELLLPGTPISEIRSLSRVVVLRSLVTTKRGERLVGFLDGHIEWIADSDLQKGEGLLRDDILLARSRR